MLWKTGNQLRAEIAEEIGFPFDPHTRDDGFRKEALQQIYAHIFDDQPGDRSKVELVEEIAERVGKPDEGVSGDEPRSANLTKTGVYEVYRCVFSDQHAYLSDPRESWGGTP